MRLHERIKFHDQVLAYAACRLPVSHHSRRDGAGRGAEARHRAWWNRPCDETSGPKPEWVSSDDARVVQDGRSYYKAVVDKQDDLELGTELATQNAMMSIRNSIMTAVGNSLQRVRETGTGRVDDPNAGSSRP